MARAGEPDFPAEWGREDSNLRRLSRRVYSPFPLAARAHPLGDAIVAVALRPSAGRLARVGESPEDIAAPDFLA